MKSTAKLLSLTILSLQLLVAGGAAFAADAKPMLPLNAKLEPITLADKSTSKKEKKNDRESTLVSKSTVETLKSGKTVLKTDVQKNTFVPKSPEAAVNSDKLLAPISVKGVGGVPLDKPGLGDRAHDLKLAPLALQPSAQEIASKLDKETQIEREQITALWQATLVRSPDINFVINKLLPSKKSQAKTIAVKLISAAVYGGLGAANMMVPGVTTNIATQMASQTMATLLGIHQESEGKKRDHESHEQIVLYQMVRETAESMVSKYRVYKKNSKSLSIAEGDLEDLSNMVAQTRGSQDASEQVKLEYVLRKQKRDIIDLKADVAMNRRSLVDMAGPEAIDSLDESMVKQMSDSLTVQASN